MVENSAERWVCTFVARSGGHARAHFVTKDLAKEFAERHARAFTPPGTRLTWQDAGDSSTLRTQVGAYVITCVEAPR